MEFFRIKKDIPFMRHALVFNIISLITFLMAVFFLVTRGLNFSIEFTGGTLLEVSYPHAPALESLRHQLDVDGFTDTQVQNFGSSRDVLIRVPPAKGEPSDVSSSKVGERVMASLLKVGAGETAVTGENTVNRPELKRVEFVGPQVGKELASDGALALLSVVIGIVAYLALRFEWRFAVSAIIANLHDVIIILGFFALFQWEFSLPVLAAVLAVLGYSVNESVVVFDRVRETFKKKRGLTTPQVLDHAITSTISRTVITHGCTQMMVTSMLIFGGAALHYFALALTIGILFGIYSSVLVASPLVMWLGVSRDQFVKAKVEKQEAVV
ncbi:preprotein translocase subunit SecF [Rugosibacter aromaticivorans]|uniref:Protein-export membrane protein SecF n=1 Tax=Rugosibacter aromaticivorans TaxID=1565605 RepID=A0A0C5J1D7_9PROT|nr:protein translocase subunit SecF [Rugosibacter aromaticivorans]AJP48937.1 preprotein translocase subunit SecF [Rugosibacter aromaticivorans]TBR13338.1 MAG: protein translocase subunit SecF [Rugosibacter sp.]